MGEESFEDDDRRVEMSLNEYDGVFEVMQARKGRATNSSVERVHSEESSDI